MVGSPAEILGGDDAKFSLLYTIALNKTSVDTTDVSVIEPAAKYYSNHGSADERLKAYYYQGVIQRDAGNLNDAAVSFHIAEQYVQNAVDRRYVGLLYSMFANVYSDTYNHAKSIGYIEMARSIYQEAGDTLNANRCLYDLACAEVGLSHYEVADSLLRYSRELMPSDTLLMGWVLSEHAKVNIYKKPSNAGEAIALLDSKRKQYHQDLTIEDYYVYACAKAMRGDTQSCQAIVDALSSIPQENQALNEYWMYRICRVSGNFEDAMDNLERTMKYQDQALYDALSSTAMEALNNYEESEMQKQKHEYQVHVMTLILLVFALLFIGGIILSLFIIDRNRKNREIDGLIGVAETKQSAYLNNFKQNLNLLVDLNHIILDAENQHSHGQALLVRLKSTVPDYCGSNEDRHELECRVNEHYGNIAADLRTDFPDLKDHDVLFYCFQILGFNANTIAVILGITVSNVYVKRKRLKEKLSQINGRPDEKYTRLM